MLKILFSFVCLLAAMRVAVASRGDPEKDLPSRTPPAFQVPKGWKAIAADSVVSARFQIGEGDRIAMVTVTGLPRDGGGLAANLNRWRKQLGLKELPEKDALSSFKAIKVDGVDAHFVDLTGPVGTDEAAQRILVVIAKSSELTWFFHLKGPASLVADQASGFDVFAKSVRFKK
jgi:hypothetical protein